MARHIGIRRWGERCFHEVEEALEDGYIVDGIFIHRDEVVDVRVWDDEDGDEKRCGVGDPSGKE